ncbi:MAG: DUF3048 domain-containing protein, partial [Acidimicrobiia bacterium]
MLRINPKLIGLFAAFAIVATACTSSQASSTTATQAPTTTQTTIPATTTTSTTTTIAPTTSTSTATIPGVEVSESINGLPGDDTLIDRRVIAVKIDNHPKARPQSGLDVAEVVYEILVEGQTRFIALYQQTDLEYVGPNRSGRPTDAAVLKWFDPVFQISGAQPWVQSVFRSEGIRVVYDNGVATYRIPSRSAPQNLYMSTIALREYADSLGWADDNPGNLFTFGDPTPGVDGADTVTISYFDTAPSVWEFDGEQYLRSTGSTPHEWITKDGESGQVRFETIVALTGRKYIARDPSGKGSSVPATDTVGSG